MPKPNMVKSLVTIKRMDVAITLSAMASIVTPANMAGRVQAKKRVSSFIYAVPANLPTRLGAPKTRAIPKTQ